MSTARAGFQNIRVQIRKLLFERFLSLLDIVPWRLFILGLSELDEYSPERSSFLVFCHCRNGPVVAGPLRLIGTGDFYKEARIPTPINNHGLRRGFAEGLRREGLRKVSPVFSL